MSNCRQWIARLWLAWDAGRPWITVPIPHIKVDYAPFAGPTIWLPIEAAVFVPGLDAVVADADP